MKTKLELVRYNYESFLFDKLDDQDVEYIRGFIPPGLGKTFTLLKYINQHPLSLYPNAKFTIIIPNHDMILGDGGMKESLDEHNIDWVHIKGKKRTHEVEDWDLKKDCLVIRKRRLCKRKSGEEYHPGCPNCPHMAPNLYNRTCGYWQQFWHLENKQVIVTTVHNVGRSDLPKDRCLVFEESFDQQIIMTRPLPSEKYVKHITFEGNSFEKAGYNKTFTFYNEVELSEDFEVKDEEGHFLLQFFKTSKNIQAVKTTKKGKPITLLFGWRDVDISQYDKILFNCATTPIDLMKYITNTGAGTNDKDDAIIFDAIYHWDIFESDNFKIDEVKNPFIKFTRNWSKKYSENSIPEVFGKINGWVEDKKLLVITKLDFINKNKDSNKCIKTYLPNADYVHYNAGRGFNKFNKDYDLVIMYGRFGFTPLNRLMLKKIGLTKEMIDQMEWSEMMQCIHRCRLLLHPDTPIMLFSDKNLFKNEKTVSWNRWIDYYNHYDFEYDGQSLRDINKKLGYNSHKSSIAKNYLRIRKFMDDILFGNRQLC